MPNLSTSLAQYLDEIGDTWIKRRKKVLEDKWNRNFKMIKGEDPVEETWKKGEAGTEPGHEWRSKTIINIVRVKVYTVFAMLLEILLPNGEIPFTLISDHTNENEISGEERAQMEDAKKEMIKDIKAKRRHRKMDRHFMKKILSLLYYGLAWSKFDIDEVKEKGFRKDPSVLGAGYTPDETAAQSRYSYHEEKKLVPGHPFRSVWNMYWDMEVDFDKLDEGQGVFERDLISLFELRKLADKEADGYLPKAIKKIIEDYSTPNESGGSNEDTSSMQPGRREAAQRNRNIDSREWWLRVPVQVINRFERDELPNIKEGDESQISEYKIDDNEATGEEVYIFCETANGEIIRYSRRPDSSLPYKLCVWEENLDEPDNPGNAPTDNMFHVQMLFTGLVRAFEDNTKLAGNVILAIKERYFDDPSQAEELFPGMKINLSDDADRASDAVQQVTIQDITGGILNGIGLAERWKDVVSMLPDLLQGLAITSIQKPDTAYEASQRQENAGKYVGQGIRNIDEALIEPETWDLYEWNMLDDEFPAQFKGSYKCTAGGYISYRTKVLTVQKIKEVLALVLASELLSAEAKPRAHLEVIYKNLDLDPDDFLKSEEEKQEEQKRAAEAQARARAQAFEDLAKQVQIQTAAKIEEAKAKATLDKDKDEDEFQRDILKESQKSMMEEGRA